MLQRLRVHEPPCGHLQFEGAATALARILFAPALLAVRMGGGAIPLPRGRSFIIRAADSASLWFSVEGFQCSRRQIFERIPALPAPIAEVSACKALRSVAGCLGYDYLLTKPEPRGCCGTLRLGGDSAFLERFCLLSEGLEDRMLALGRLSGGLVMHLPVDHAGVSGSISLESLSLELRTALRTLKLAFSQQSLIIKGEEVSAIEPPARCTVNLGEIELSMMELLRLRAGDSISFSVPPAYEGVLEFGGRAWAKVSIEISGTEVKLEVLELFI